MDNMATAEVIIPLQLSEGGSANSLARSLGTFAQHLCRLVAADTTTPLAALFLVFVGAVERSVRKGWCRQKEYLQVGLGGTDKGGQLALILALHVLNGQDSSSLLMHNGAKAGFALHNDVGNAHLSAEGREVYDKLNRIDVMGDNDQGGLLGLDEGNTVIKAVLHEEGLLRLLSLPVRH